MTFIWQQFHKKYLIHQSVTEISLKMSYRNFHSNLPGAHELMWWRYHSFAWSCWYGIIRPRSVNSVRLSDAYMCWWSGSSSDQIMTCRLFGAKPLSWPMLIGMYCKLDLKAHFSNFIWNLKKKILLKMLSATQWPFCLSLSELTHWGRVTHICVGNLTIIGSDNGLSHRRAKPLSEPMLGYC